MPEISNTFAPRPDEIKMALGLLFQPWVWSYFERFILRRSLSLNIETSWNLDNSFYTNPTRFSDFQYTDQATGQLYGPSFGKNLEDEFDPNTMLTENQQNDFKTISSVYQLAINYYILSSSRKWRPYLAAGIGGGKVTYIRKNVEVVYDREVQGQNDFAVYNVETTNEKLTSPALISTLSAGVSFAQIQGFRFRTSGYKSRMRATTCLADKWHSQRKRKIQSTCSTPNHPTPDGQ